MENEINSKVHFPDLSVQLQVTGAIHSYTYIDTQINCISHSPTQWLTKINYDDSDGITTSTQTTQCTQRQSLFTDLQWAIYM